MTRHLRLGQHLRTARDPDSRAVGLPGMLHSDPGSVGSLPAGGTGSPFPQEPRAEVRMGLGRGRIPERKVALRIAAVVQAEIREGPRDPAEGRSPGGPGNLGGTSILACPASLWSCWPLGTQRDKTLPHRGVSLGPAPVERSLCKVPRSNRPLPLYIIRHSQRREVLPPIRPRSPLLETKTAVSRCG